MKIKEFFGFSTPKEKPGSPKIERATNPGKSVGPETVEEQEIQGIESKYMKELKDYQNYTDAELRKIEEEFQAAVQGLSDETEIERLLIEKNRKQEIIRENLRKVTFNVLDGLEEQRDQILKKNSPDG